MTSYVRQPPYMVVTQLVNGTYSIWYQNPPLKGKTKLLQTMKCERREEAEQYARSWERVHGVQAIWRKEGDIK